ncbi:unnamed protein product [Anisakis simplex]|uniref:Uncharacterized protein n=1 Tax=Anisakis simplex TaxID=6269 RepID=A0A0M3K1J6_ANISI|nr:unnamed protein product [Anisakis simplex]
MKTTQHNNDDLVAVAGTLGGGGVRNSLDSDEMTNDHYNRIASSQFDRNERREGGGLKPDNATIEYNSGRTSNRSTDRSEHNDGRGRDATRRKMVK